MNLQQDRPLCHDVMVTGIGVVSACGLGAERVFERIASGESLVSDNPHLVALGFDNPAAAWITPEILAEVDAANGGREDDWGVPTCIALAAAQQAWRDAGLPPAAHAVDIRGGVFFASNRQLFDEIELVALARDMDDTGIDFDRYLDHIDSATAARCYFHRQQDLAALVLAERFGLQQQHGAHGEACAAGAMAIASAAEAIRSGRIDLALVGASEAPCNLVPLVAFNSIGALASAGEFKGAAISRPFDRDRCGFVMGEGSTFLVLESRASARRRGAMPMARVAGFAGLLEAQRITSSDDLGDQYARCIRLALRDAGVQAEDIDHINAHGTSTPSNDACEALALKQVFGERIAQVPLTANKSALGHSLGNSGAIEAVLSVLSLQCQAVLPTLNFNAPDEHTAGLNIPTVLQRRPLRRVLSNSFGFGGSNVALVLEAA